MSVTITCPACKQSFGLAVPQRANITASKIKLEKDRDAKPGDFTICMKCLVWLRHNETEWAVLTDDELLAMSDDDRIGMQRIQKVLAKKLGKDDPKPTDADGRLECGCLPEEHEAKIDRISAILLSVPAHITKGMIDKRKDDDDLKEFVQTGLAALIKSIKNNSDPVEDNIRDLTSVTLALCYIMGNGTLEGAQREAEACLKATEETMGKHNIKVVGLPEMLEELLGAIRH